MIQCRTTPASWKPNFLLYSYPKSLDQKSNFQPRLVWTRPYKSWIWPKRGENIAFKSRDWYYIVSMYKCYQLTLFQVLIRKFDQKPNFYPWSSPYKSRIGPKRGKKYDFQELRVALHSFHTQIRSIKLISTLN